MTNLEKTIERAKQELEQMIDLNPEVMLLSDQNRRIIRANKALLDLVGMEDFGDVLGHPLDELFTCVDANFFTDLLEKQQGYGDCQTEAVLPNGVTRPLRFIIVGAGEAREVVAVIVQDLSVKRQEEATQEKEHKKQAVEELVGALMHNLNQPLTVIMLRAQLVYLDLEKGTMSQDEIKRSLRDIMTLTEKVADMVKHLENPRDYVTQEYYGGVDILDLSRSSDETRASQARVQRLQTLVLVLDTHLPGAARHAVRTGEYAVFLAEKLGLPPEEIASVGRCATLHDVGKIGVSSHLLLKPAALTPDEAVRVKEHVEKGYQLLVRCSLLEEAEAAYGHHEHFDGSGYPRRLSGEDLSLATRITSVADAYEVLRFGRAYRAAMPTEEVLAEIVAGSGSQFDPEVVKVLAEHWEEMDPTAEPGEPGA